MSSRVSGGPICNALSGRLAFAIFFSVDPVRFFVQLNGHLRECLPRIVVSRETSQLPALLGAETKALRVLTHARAN